MNILSKPSLGQSLITNSTENTHLTPTIPAVVSTSTRLDRLRWRDIRSVSCPNSSISGVFPDSVPETDVGDAPSRWGIEPYLATTLLLEALEHD